MKPVNTLGDAYKLLEAIERVTNAGVNDRRVIPHSGDAFTAYEDGYNAAMERIREVLNGRKI